MVKDFNWSERGKLRLKKWWGNNCDSNVMMRKKW